MALLTVLSEEDLPAYRIWTTFRTRTGGVWPLNIGQVSTTLARLQTQHLIYVVGTDQSDVNGREAPIYGLTPEGREAVESWWRESPDRTVIPRDDLGMKAALALSATDIDISEWGTHQKHDLLRQIRDLTRLRTQVDNEPTLNLSLDRALMVAEADYKWLDQVIATAHASGHRKARSANASAPTPTQRTTRSLC